jgi:hypothetical protein
MSIEFTHRQALDPDWEPRDGQKWKDAPKARMRVTKMTTYAVYYTYADSPSRRGSWSMARTVWDRDYAQSLPSATTEGEGS